jgi:superfamily II DNA helicase RecQ
MRDVFRGQAQPSFFIFSDTVLRSVVLAAPASVEALGVVRGMEAQKVERFGGAVVALCCGMPATNPES